MIFARALSKRTTLAQAERRLAPLPEARRRRRARWTLPLRAVLWVVEYMVMPLVWMIGALMSLVYILGVLKLLVVAIGARGVLDAWSEGELRSITALAVGMGILLWGSWAVVKPMVELKAWCAAATDDWRARCLHTARQVLTRLAQSLDAERAVRVVVDIPNVDSWASSIGYPPLSSSLVEAEHTWLTIEGQGAPFPVRVGVTVNVGGGRATVIEFLEVHVPLTLTRPEAWAVDAELPVYSTDDARRRVVFANACSWDSDPRGKGLSFPTLGGDFQSEPLLRRLNEALELSASTAPDDLADLPRRSADRVPALVAALAGAAGLLWLGIGLEALTQAHRMVDPEKGVAGAPAGILAGLFVLFVIPAAFMGKLASGLWARERGAWVHLVVSSVVPLPFIALGLPIWMALAPLPAALLVLPKPVRWRFGIGPGALLADIDARKIVSIADLAETHGVDRAAVVHLLEHTQRCGRFTGGIDRARSEALSADTVANDLELQRCPNCAGTTRAVGSIARCGYCGTELAGRTHRDPPMPLPIGLEVVSTALGMLGGSALSLSLVWTVMLFAGGILDASRLMQAWAFFLCVVLPVGFFVATRKVGPGLVVGARSSFWGAVALCPPLFLYLRRHTIRPLFGFGLEPLLGRLAERGEVSFDEAASLLAVPGADVGRLVPFLVGKGWMDAVVDWPKHNVVRRDRLAHDGREHCASCGSALRLGGQCGYCGRAAAVLS